MHSETLSKLISAIICHSSFQEIYEAYMIKGRECEGQCL